MGDRWVGRDRVSMGVGWVRLGWMIRDELEPLWRGVVWMRIPFLHWVGVWDI